MIAVSQQFRRIKPESRRENYPHETPRPFCCTYREKTGANASRLQWQTPRGCSTKFFQNLERTPRGGSFLFVFGKSPGQVANAPAGVLVRGAGTSRGTGRSQLGVGTGSTSEASRHGQHVAEGRRAWILLYSYCFQLLVREAVVHTL